MPYTTNPYLPRLRMQTANLVIKSNWSVRQAARHVSVNPSTVSRWVKKAKMTRLNTIPTESSRPHSHPNELSQNIVSKIIKLRKSRNRCSEVVHQEMINLGHSVSLSSVKRTLERNYLIRKRSPWKRWHFEQERPKAFKPGDLVELDTIHIIPGNLYVYTMIDVFSRWAFARVSERINTHKSLKFVGYSQKVFPHPFRMLQSDHGSEFSIYFTENIKTRLGSNHRHSRIRKPSDNGYVERFNRTLKEECLYGIPRTIRNYQRQISRYLDYYNNQRLHLGLNLKTPAQVLRRY